MADWLALMTALRKSGKRIERVRLISEPASDYSRYRLWLCRYNVDAGEDIRYLNRENAAGLPDHDYWLFDSTRLYTVRFDEADDLVGFESVEDPATVLQHNYWRDVAWHYTIPHAEYMRASGRAVEHPAGA